MNDYQAIDIEYWKINLIGNVELQYIAIVRS